MEIFVSAGEASSDIHCAHLLSQLKTQAAKRDPQQKLSFFGLGGDRLAAEGVQLLMHNREFSVGGGPVEILSRLPRRRRLERLLEQQLFERRIDGAILVDNGEINLRLASMLHFFGVPVVYFIPPKVWVWRASRLEDIAQHVNLVLSILPFEEPLYKAWEIPFQYVGNPLVDEIRTDLSADQARQRLGVGPGTPVIAVLPGSRHNEVRYHGDLFARGILRMVESLPASEPKPLVLVPVAQAIEPGDVEAPFRQVLAAAGIEVRCVKGDRDGIPVSHDAMRVARAALVKSGTSTLEAALIGAPMVLAYYTSRSSEWLFRNVVRYRGFVGLVNLFLADETEAALGWDEPVEPVVPEVILSGCTPDRIAAELVKIYRDGPERERMLARLSKTRSKLLPPRQLGASPLEAAARATLECFASPRPPRGLSDAVVAQESGT